VGIAFSREKITPKLFQELTPLIAGHYVEISHYKDIECVPDWAHYERLDKADILKIFTVRRGDELVGYSVFFVAPHPHFKKSIQATEDLLYLDPDFRKGRMGHDFIAFCDKCLADDHVDVVYRHVTTKKDFSALLTRMEYDLVDLVYARRLNHG